MDISTDRIQKGRRMGTRSPTGLVETDVGQVVKNQGGVSPPFRRKLGPVHTRPSSSVVLSVRPPLCRWSLDAIDRRPATSAKIETLEPGVTSEGMSPESSCRWNPTTLLIYLIRCSSRILPRTMTHSEPTVSTNTIPCLRRSEGVGDENQGSS